MVPGRNYSRRSYSRSCYRYGGSLMAELLFHNYAPHDSSRDLPHFFVVSTPDSPADIHFGGLSQEEYLSTPGSQPMTLESWQAKVTGRKSLLFHNTWGYYNSQRRTSHSEVVRPKRSQSAPSSSRRSGSKSRRRCPPGFYWNGHRCVKR